MCLQMVFQKRRHFEPAFLFLILLFLGWFAWGIMVNITNAANDQRDLFASTYFVVPFIGGIVGLIASNWWGGLKSFFGRALFFFSMGLLLQVFGQLAYSYYIMVLGVDIPYPSVGDIGFFGSIPAYILGAINLAKASGSDYVLKTSLAQRLFALFLPLAMLLLSAYLFLAGVNLSEGVHPSVLLDLGYPLGQSIYVAIIIIAFFSSRSVLGGVLKKHVRLLMFGLFAQYIADFVFLYRAQRDQYIAGGPSDMLYLCAYFLIGMGLSGFISAYSSIKNKKAKVHSAKLNS